MNADPENQNFENLKKLLALKRHEQPPPGYFDQLPNKIWTRIEMEEAQPSFWQRWIPSFCLKPAVAYSFALIVCGTMIIGIGSAIRTDESQTASSPGNGKSEAVAVSPVLPTVPAGFVKSSGPQPLNQGDTNGTDSSSSDVKPVGFKPTKP